MQEKQNEQDVNKNENGENKENITPLNIKKMTKEELKSLAEALINENSQIEKELDLLKKENEKLDLTAKKASQLSAMYSAISKDFEQYRKRNAEIEQISKDNAISDIVLKIMPIYDNIKLATASMQDEKSKEGINLIVKQFNDILKSLGIEEMKCEGEEFDPVKHNALMAEEIDDENKKGTIKTVFSDGYIYKDKVIKQSQVVVYK